jgi:hypothetical protein
MLFSGAPWRAAAYVWTSIVLGTVFFILVTTLLAVSLGLTAAFWLGAPLLAVTFMITRWAAWVERARAGGVSGIRVPSPYRLTSGGFRARLLARWRDRATWRDCLYLIPMYVPLLVLDAVAGSIWLALAAGVTVPIWYWSIPAEAGAHGLSFGTFPHGPDGPGAHGLFVGDVGTALLVAAGSFVVLLAANYLLVAAARAHAALARSLLGPRRDPLAAAKGVLDAPGPLPEHGPAASLS